MSVFNLENLLKFTMRDLKVRGEVIKDIHLRQIESGIGADGKQFPSYTRRYKNRKAAGKAHPSQASREISPPDLTLTGKMLSEFKVQDFDIYGGVGARPTSGSQELVIRYGIPSGPQAVKMKAHAQGRFGRPGKKSKITKRSDKKRVVAANQKVGPDVEKAIGMMFVEVIAKNLRKLTNRPTIIRM